MIGRRQRYGGRVPPRPGLIERRSSRIMVIVFATPC